MELQEQNGYGVWIDQPENAAVRYLVEGFDPGVALRSVFCPVSGLILTMLGNTQDALWPLFKEIDRLLPRCTDSF